MRGLTYRTRTSYGNLFVTINEDDHGPFEVFSSLGKAGGFFHAQTEAICRLISLALRSGIAITEIIDQLKGIRGPDIIFANGGTIHSLPDAIGQVLENHIKRGQTELGLKFTKEDETEAVNELQNLLNFDPKNGFARDQLIIYYMENDVKKAISLANQSRQINPDNPLFSLHLAEIYAKSSDCTRANSFAQEAKTKSFHHPIIDGYADEATKTCPS